MTSDFTLGPVARTRGDLDDLAMVAARAFHHDPFFEFLDPQSVTRARGLPLFWRATVAALGPGAQLTGARDGDGRLLGVAVVCPPGSYPPPVAGQLRQLAGAFRAMVVRPPALVHGMRYLTAVETNHPKEPVWYLLLLVVDPLVQRSGLGTRLQQAMLESADGEGLDCYLETQKEENVPYYGRFGYEVVKELRPVKSGPPLWTMRRSPH